jgi:hypothetical protein
MRPILLSFTPLDDSTTYFASGLTGATGTLTTNAVSDNMAHKVSLTSAANLSAITITVAGLDADGQAQTEAITGPNANTVAGSKFFSRSNTIVFSSTLGANTMDVGITDAAVSQTVPMNYMQQSWNATFMVDISGTINYDVEYTEQAIYDTQPSALVWFNHATLVNKTADADGVTTSPIRAVRLAINSSTGGATASLTILQGRG